MAEAPLNVVPHDDPPRDDDDKLREECGVFGVWGAEDASVLVALGLHALQHRGQEGCGIVSMRDRLLFTERHLGLVGDRFGAEATPALSERLPGRAAIGHTRYGTSGGRRLRNVQPLYAEIAGGGFAIAHNGNLTNANRLRSQLVQSGAIFQSTSDTEVIVHLVARSRAESMLDRFAEALLRVEGGFALACLTPEGMLAARDPIGIRPLVLGWLGGAPVLASETCALSMVGAKFDREIENGEILAISSNEDGSLRIESRFPWPKRPARPCLFEYVYFSRPDSVVGGRPVYDVRRRMGRQLAREQPASADVVVPVPDSGVAAALGFAEVAGLPYEMGIIRSHYVPRTFIQPTQRSRSESVSLKHSANKSVLDGRRVILVDDSIVRGTTSKQIVQLVRDAGAAEVHFRSASPQIRFGDYYGIDMPNPADLLAARHNGDVAGMAQWLGADSLGFLSVDGVYAALGLERDAEQPQFSDHYFTGDFPTRLTDVEEGEGPIGSQP